MKYIKYFIPVLMLLLIISCDKSAEMLPKNYPYPVINDIDIFEDSVIAEATITNHASVLFDSYGFIWGDESNTIMVTQPETNIDKNGVFSMSITADLIKSRIYFIKPYAIQGDRKIIGEPQQFVGVSTIKPVFEDFSPKEGDSGDTITIIGKNFSYSKSLLNVYVGNNKASIVYNTRDTIQIVIPQDLKEVGEVKIYVVSGVFTLESVDNFIIYGQGTYGFIPNNRIIINSGN